MLYQYILSHSQRYKLNRLPSFFTLRRKIGCSYYCNVRLLGSPSVTSVVGVGVVSLGRDGYSEPPLKMYIFS